MLTVDPLRDFAACLARRVGDGLALEAIEILRSKLLIIEAPESITRTNHASHEKAVDALLTRVARRVEEGWATVSAYRCQVREAQERFSREKRARLWCSANLAAVVPAPLRLRDEAGAECALWLPLDGVPSRRIRRVIVGHRVRRSWSCTHTDPSFNRGARWRSPSRRPSPRPAAVA
jgi:hypothetical protein